jgi:predicted enzyme related to lactoylglutathione lyase
MELAKPCIDIGLNTVNGEAMLQFWRDAVGLAYEGPLPIRRGVVQHRFECGGSIVKINVHASGLAAEPAGGYREVLVARPGLARPVPLKDPDGNAVCLWPAGDAGIDQMGVRVAVRDVARHGCFLSTALGLDEQASDGPGSACFAAGRSRLILEADPAVPVDTGFNGPGWRYITFQVFKVDEAHARVLESGAREARAPITLGTTARISMVLDPDGNWIELSQRASLVGPLD